MVVVVGGPTKMIEAAKKAATAAAGAISVACPVSDAATTAAKNRPFALVMSQEVYEFDCDEFVALARDVKAELIAIPTRQATREELQKKLIPLIELAFSKSGRL